MNTVAYLRLFRWPNLLAIVLSQCLFYYLLLLPLSGPTGLSGSAFSLLVMITVMISAAGYAINDYYDLGIDKVNKPNRMVLDNLLSPGQAWSAHFLLAILAMLLAACFAVFVHTLTGLILLTLPLLSWLYSRFLQRILLAGNLLVAVFAGLMLLLVWLASGRLTAGDRPVEDCPVMAGSLLVYMYVFFSFFSTLLRELLKDMEDMEGDRQHGCRTLPVVIGPGPAQVVAFMLTALLIVGVGYVLSQAIVARMWWLAVYLAVAVTLPFLWLIVRIALPGRHQQAGMLQRMLKLIMIAGVFSMLVVYYYIRIGWIC